MMAFLLSSFLFAQKDSLSIQNLETIVIQNERLQIPYTKQNRDITILDRAVIKAMPVKSVNALLSYVSGIDVRQRGGMGSQADISINGGTFDQTLILLNGMKIIDPQTGHNIMNLPLNLGAVKRIEILKGSAASVYGVNALNGAINIVTRQPDKTGIGTTVRLGSSFDTDSVTKNLYSGFGTEVSASLSRENTKHFLSLATVQSNGYRHNTGVDTKKILYTNHINVGKGNHIKMMGGYVTNAYGANGFYAAPKDTEAKEKVQTAIGSIGGKVKIADWWALKPGINYRYSHDVYTLDKKHPAVYQNKHYTNAFNTKLNNSFYSKIGTFGFGVEMRNVNINSNSLGQHSRTNLGFFGNYNFALIPKTSVTIGIYSNYNKKFGWDWMPSIDAGYQINTHIRVFANMGTGLRLPTYTDLYYTGPINIGNPALQPEKAFETAVGIKYHKAHFKASANYFYRHTDDFIDWVKTDLDAPWHTQNYQNIKTQGLSLSADYRLFPKNKVNGNSLLAGISYTYLKPKIEKIPAHKFSHYGLENLKHQLIGRVDVQAFHRFNFTLSGKYAERVSYTDYFLLAARIAATFDRFQLYIDADNLTNVQYIEAGAVPLPGRWVSLGMKWQWWK